MPSRRVFGLWLIALTAVCTGASAQPSRVVTRDVDAFLEVVGGQQILHVQGSWYDMGRQHGALLAGQVRENITAFLNDWALRRLRGRRERLQRIWDAVAPVLPQRYKDELRGLADGSGVPLADIQLAHAIPTRFHCSGVAAMGEATVDGRVYHTRSLDYPLNIGRKKTLQENACVIVYKPSSGQPYVSIGWAGFVGCVSGMNAAGVSIGEMGSSSRDESHAGIPMIFLVREALWKGDSLDAALEVFRKGPRTCGYNFIFTDGKIPAVRAVEVTRTLMRSFAPGDPAGGAAPHAAIPGVVVRTNHFVGADTAATQRKEYDPRLSATRSWLLYDLLSSYVRRHLGRIDAGVMIDQLRQYPPEHSCLHQAVFCSSTLDFWVSNAAPPSSGRRIGAQNQTFYRYNLADLLAGRNPVSRWATAPPPVHAERDDDAAVTEGAAEFQPCEREAELPEPYRLPATRFPFVLRRVETGPEMDVYTLQFPSPVKTPHPANNVVHAEYYLPKTGRGPHPGVVMLHILDGRFYVARLFSRMLAQRGAAVLFVKMAYYGERRPAGMTVHSFAANVPMLLQAVRQSVLDIRLAAAWLSQRPEVDSKRLAITGVSLGGIMSAITGALEPRFTRVAPLLAGGDFAKLIYESPEARRARRAWEKVGGTREALAVVVRGIDPLTFAPRLKGREVFMINAKRDRVVPPPCTLALWEAAGRPPIKWFDCTHTGALAYIVPVVQILCRHLADWAPLPPAGGPLSEPGRKPS